MSSLAIENIDPSLSTFVGPRRLHLIPLEQLRNHPAVIALVIEASFDEEICAKNYLLPQLDEARARQYCAESDALIFWLDDKPIGATVVRHDTHPGKGIEIPAGCVELDEWLLQPYRGQGLMGRRIGWPLITAWLSRRFDHVLSMTWEDNHAAINLLRTRGYLHIGKSFWSAPGYSLSGYCEAFLYDLAPHRSVATR